MSALKPQKDADKVVAEAQAEDDFVEMLEEAELELPPSPAPRPNPSKLRFAALLMIAVYPIITGLLYALGPFTAEWPIWQRTFIITPFMVLSIIFAVSPTINRYFGWFVAGLPRPKRMSL